MNDQPVVQVIGVERTYKLGQEEVRALKGIDLTIPRGRMVCLMGRSGSGKTTLLNIIGGLDKPDAGQVILDGQAIHKLPDHALTEFRRNRIGFVFQSFSLMPVLSALENVELPMHIAGIPRAQRHKRALELLQLVGLTKRMHHRPFELSGGEQQRVGIARALSNNPAIILADEPTGELDSVTGLSILKLFYQIASEGTTVIVVTHDPMVSEIAHETYDLVDGVIHLRQAAPVHA